MFGPGSTASASALYSGAQIIEVALTPVFLLTGLATLLWAGPFIPIIPGTDTYTDQLW